MTARVQRQRAALLVAAAVSAAILLAAHPAGGWCTALVAAPSAVVAVRVLFDAGAGLAGRRRQFAAASIAVYAAVAAVDAGGGGLTAGHHLLGGVALLLAVSAIAMAPPVWRSQEAGGLGLVGLDAVIAGLAAAVVGGVLVSARYTGLSADRVLLAAADLFAGGYIAAAGVAAEYPRPPHSLLAGAGLVLLGLADAAYGSRLGAGHLRPSRLVLAAWPVGVALYGTALLREPREPRLRPLATIAFPALAGALSLWAVITHTASSPGGIAAAAVLVLAGVRLSVSLVENLSLVEGTNRSAARQEAIASLGRRALEGAELEHLMVAGMTLARRLTRADAASFGEVAPDGMLRFRATVGFTEILGRDPSGEVVRGGEALRDVVRHGETVLIEDWPSDRRFAPSSIAAEIGTRSAIGVSVPRSGGRAWTLIVNSRRSHAFEDADAVFLQAVANVIASAGERLATDAEIRELAAARERLVAEALDAEQRERRRISEALHDTALQELLAAGQDLDDAVARDGVHLESKRRARAGVARAVGDLRDAVAELHPVVLEHAGLEPAIEAVAQRQAARAGFTYELDVDDTAARGHEDVLFPLARELLSNVARHAHAHEVRVCVRAREDRVTLEVTDDGCGIDPSRLAAAPGAGHIGIASWRMRVEALGGALTVRPGRERGTVAYAELPLLTPS